MTKAQDSTGIAPAASTLLTLLIADVRGYSSFTESRGDEEAARLAGRFAALAQEAAREHGGEVIELRGDEAFAVFSSARRALLAALDLQARCARAVAEDPTLPILIGIGLDAGEPVPIGSGFRGNALNLAARLCGLAGPGQIFASEAVVHLARKLDGVAFIDRQEVHLKGLSQPVRVIQIAAAGTLPAEMPPLQSREVETPTNLPDAPTPFVGRRREVEDVTVLLQTPGVRLVTLTGPGGTGKTRLGLEVGAVLRQIFKDGVFLVSLAALSEPSLVASAIAATLGVQQTGAQPLSADLAAFLKDRHLLLILDNFEHLPTAARLVAELLAGCSRLSVLVTSRSVLRLSREHEYPVDPLPVPDPRHPPSLEALMGFDAVRLFVERAQSVRPQFTLTGENAAAVAEICARLDGLPLALELAAARLRLFPPQALLARLSSRLKLLTGGARDLPERQQTLRATVDWSYGLLDSPEQTLFTRLAVFAGGSSLEAIEAVCDADGDLGIDVLDGVSSLLEKSLLRQEGEGEPWFLMLETVREYAMERLEERGQADALRQRHAQYYLRFAEEAEEKIRGAEQQTWMARLDADLDDLRLALGWLIERGDSESALRMGGALWRFWWARGLLSEGRRWLDAALELPGTSQAIRARALNGAANLASSLGELGQAEALHREALALREKIGDRSGIALSLNNLGVQAEQQERFEQAAALYEQSLAVARDVDDRWIIALALGNLGGVLVWQRQFDRASEVCEESVRLWRELGDRVSEARVLNNLVFLSLEQGALDRAAQYQVESLVLCRDLGARENMAVCLEGAAHVAVLRRQPGTAIALWRAADALRETLGQSLSQTGQEERSRYLQLVRDQLEEETYSALWSGDEIMMPDVAARFALESLSAR